MFIRTTPGGRVNVTNMTLKEMWKMRLTPFPISPHGAPLKVSMRPQLTLSALFLTYAFIITGTSVPSQGTDNSVGPTEFYVVSEVTSDASPFWNQYVLQVKPEGQGSRVRWIRIAPMDSLCSRAVIVEAATSVLPNTSPVELSEGFNVCSVDSDVLDHDLRKRRTTVIDDSVRFGVVGRCGDKDVVLHFPYREQVNPDIAGESARWLDFERVIRERAFGRDDIFDTVSYEKAVELEREGAIVVPELRAGLFDKALSPECAPLATCPLRSLRDQLNAYVGPIGIIGPVARLAEDYRFVRYVAAAYPPFALKAHISGPVGLDLKVDPRTGVVREAKVVTGHPTLRDAALAAAGQWQFAADQIIISGHVSATLIFKFSCPQPMLEP
jgi:hypothetical protein